MYVCMYVCMYVYGCACSGCTTTPNGHTTHMHTRVRVHTHTHACHACIHTRTIQACVRVRVRAHIQTPALRATCECNPCKCAATCAPLPCTSCHRTPRRSACVQAAGMQMRGTCSVLPHTGERFSESRLHLPTLRHRDILSIVQFAAFIVPPFV